MKKDKSQGIVFVLPKSREFFGRISPDFQKTGVPTECIKFQPEQRKVEAENLKTQMASLNELKKNLSKLSHLHQRLKIILQELDQVIKE